MYNVTDVVKHLLAINILMFIGTMLMGEPTHADTMNLVNYPDVSRLSEWQRLQLAMFFPTSDYFRPFQIVTHMFMHGDLMHLFFNMFALFMFGPPLESTWGPKRFLFFYLVTGFGALALYLFTQYLEVTYLGAHPKSINMPMLGASGAVFGLLAGFGTLFPNTVIQLLIPPIPIKAKYFVLIYAGIELFLGLGRFSTGVAHFAHLGGALFGFLLIVYWRNTNNRF